MLPRPIIGLDYHSQGTKKLSANTCYEAILASTDFPPEEIFAFSPFVASEVRPEKFAPAAFEKKRATPLRKFSCQKFRGKIFHLGASSVVGASTIA